MKKVFIVIVHYGKVEVTKKCLQSLFSSKATFDHIVIINNDSSILNHKVFRDKRITIYQNEVNVGFASAVNQGIEIALFQNPKYILLLNNDTIVHDNFIEDLLKCLKLEKNIGIIAPVIQFKKDNTSWFDLGGRVNRLLGRTTHKNVSEVTSKKLLIVDYVSGCCMLIRARIINEVGFFDSNFFLYYEDVDFCLRAKKTGWKVGVCPDARIEHVLSSSVGKNSNVAFYHQTKSALLFGKKWASSFFYPHTLFQSFVFLTHNPSAGPHILKAWKKALHLH